MLFTATLFAVLATLSSASPIEKRYTGAIIKSYRTGTCLSLAPGTAPADNAPLTVVDCSKATRWDINPGSGSVIITGTNFALDAGTNPHNNAPAKVFTSYPGLTQQTWFLTGDNRIAITGGNQCLDEDATGPQTYQCTTGNTNQIWYVSQPGTPSSSVAPVSSSKAPASSSKAPASSSKAPASSSKAPASSTVSSASASSTPTGKGYTIRWKGDTSKCATIQGPFADNTPVNLAPCTGASTQQFMFGQQGGIQAVNTASGNFCLDAGSNPSSGTAMKIYQCYPGAPQQTFSYPTGPSSGLYQTANNQCLDVNNQGNTEIQTWTCSSSDPQQQFQWFAL